MGRFRASHLRDCRGRISFFRLCQDTFAANFSLPAPGTLLRQTFLSPMAFPAEHCSFTGRTFFGKKKRGYRSTISFDDFAIPSLNLFPAKFFAALNSYCMFLFMQDISSELLLQRRFLQSLLGTFPRSSHRFLLHTNQFQKYLH